MDTDEMVVLSCQVPLIRQSEPRITNMFGVSLDYGDIHGDDGPEQQQWINVKGALADRQRAKEYLRCLNAPTERIKVEYPAQLRPLITNPAVHARLEMQSQAVIVFSPTSPSLRILGTDTLPVTLALSAVEDLINTYLQQSAAEDKEDVASHAGKHRLDKELRRLSDNSVHIPDTACASTTDAVKRATLLWLQETASPKCKQGATQAHRDLLPCARMSTKSDDIQGTSASTSAVKSPMRTETFLGQFALDKGYTRAEIDAVQNAHQEHMTASNFLSLLVDHRCRHSSSSSSSPVSSPHLHSYLTKLQHHYKDEDESSSLEQLKRNNTARQRLLRAAIDPNCVSDDDDDDDDDNDDDEDVQFLGWGVQTPPRTLAVTTRTNVPNGVSSVNKPQPLAGQLIASCASSANGTASARFPQPPVHINGGVKRKQPERTPAAVPALLGGASVPPQNNLRYIVIDGSNVAMAHGNNTVFSCQGIKLCVDYFLRRGHRQITAFVPHWRCEAPRSSSPISCQNLLHTLKNDGYLVFTPSRKIPGKNIACYDDRFHFRLAQTTDGVIVSNDNFRDLWYEKPEWRDIIANRLVMYSFVGDIFMVPDDPLGRDGPTLDQLLRMPDRISPMLNARMLHPTIPRDKYSQAQQEYAQQLQRQQQQQQQHRIQQNMITYRR